MKGKVSLGIAPIGWTNDDMPDLGAENTFEQCVSEMALAGFTGCEIGNKYPKDAAVLKTALELRGMRIASRWFSSFLTTESYEENERAFMQELSFLRSLGANRINVSEQGHSIQGKQEVNVFGGKYRMNDAEWQQLASGLDRLGARAAGEGFKLCYHHHMGTVVETAEETARLMDSTDRKAVFLCYDTGHFTFSGADPLAELKRHRGRIGHVHLKDVRPAVLDTARKNGWSFLKCVREGAFTVPGDGGINFAPIFDELGQSGYEGWLLVEAEQDPAKANPFEYALKARKYIQKATGI